MPDDKPSHQDAACPGVKRRRLHVAAAAALAVLAIAAITPVWNSDIFSHLACGRWMFDNGQVLSVDPFTAEPEDPGAEWVNVHWGFQIIVAALHAVGGFELLSIFKAALAAAMLVTFALALRKDAPAPWVLVCGVLVFFGTASRVRVRPEIVTMLLSIVTIALLEGVRRGGPPRRLWALAPIMILWVNVQGLYILGLGLIWSAVLGALIDRRLGRRKLGGNLLTAGALVPLAVATVAICVSPWPVKAALHPVLLWTRISGGSEFYTYGVGELAPLIHSTAARTIAAMFDNPAALALVVLAAAAIAANGIAGLVTRTRAVPTGHLLWLGAFVGLWLLAMRNAGLASIVCGYLLAVHGGGVLGKISRRAGPAPRLVTWATIAMLLPVAALACALASGWLYRWRGSPDRFAAGLRRQAYLIGPAKYLRDLDAEGNILCQDFGDASVFNYYCPPRRLTWMDGRLEAHPAARFRRQHRITLALNRRQSADSIRLPESVRFIVVSRRNPSALTAVSQSRRFKLVHLGIAGACFARRDWRPQRASAKTERPLPRMANVADFDRPLDPGMIVAGVESPRAVWYRANPPSPHADLGGMFLALGRQPAHTQERAWDPLAGRCALLAIRYLTAAADQQPPCRTVGMLARAHWQWAARSHQAISPAVPIDIHFARALHLYRRIDLAHVDAKYVWAFALARMGAMVQAGHFDAAKRELDALLDILPARARVNPPKEYRRLRETLAEKTDDVERMLAGDDFQAADLLGRVRLLARTRIGMTDRAIAELQAYPQPTTGTRIALGDLLLRQGRPSEAVEQYKRISTKPDRRWQVELRLALCDWVGGNLHAAADTLQSLSDSSGQPLVRFYLGMLAGQLGLYDQAAAALADTRDAGPLLTTEIDRARERLQRP